MQLFQNNNNTLNPIEKDSFKLEKEIQSLVECNMETLFGLEFVSSELSVGKFRLDSLAFDKNNQSFVIIEYKKGRSDAVIDQGFSYLLEMLNNKAACVLEYNEKTGNTLRRADIDWGSSRVIFVSPSFNTHQRNSMNFRDLPFSLWEIKKFKNGWIAIEQYESSSNESIQKLYKNNSDSVVSKVSSEVEVCTEEDHVYNLDESFRPIWANLKEKLKDYTDTSFSATKVYISWKKDNKVVCYIHFQNKGLKIDIRRGSIAKTNKQSKPLFTMDDPKKIAKEGSWKLKVGGGGHAYTINLKKQKELSYVIFLLEQKYNSID